MAATWKRCDISPRRGQIWRSRFTLSLKLPPLKTVYTASQQPVAHRADIASKRSQQTRYRLEEDFSDFQPSDGLTLPGHYEPRFTEEMGSGFTKSVWWSESTNRILSNVSLDPRNFEAK